MILDKFIRKKAEGLFRGGLKEKIFLQAGLDRAASMKKIDTLFVASSYAKYGIVSNLWPNAINLGGQSQDLYYAKKIAELICTHIDRVIILCGYYSPYSDLSLAKNERKSFVGSVYWPILGDSHNWEYPKDISHWHKQYRYPASLRQYCEKILYEYFFRTNAWYDSIVKRKGNFSLLPIKEKQKGAKERTILHNKLINYKGTYRENVSLLKEFKEKMDEMGTQIFIVIPPFTQLYLDAIDTRYIDDFHEFCKKTGTVDGFIDCNKSLNYDDELFVDADHLNDAGAVRFTKDLMKLL